MKDRPMLFSAAMVRAILAGQKTQTRRVVNPQPVASEYEPDILHYYGRTKKDSHRKNRLPIPKGTPYTATTTTVGFASQCPYGQPGDRLYVRETWAEADTHDGTPVVAYRAGGCVAAGKRDKNGPNFLIRDYAWPDTPHVDRWYPSIHMPRWASRITLEIVSVRVERLNDINRGDCMAEGCPFPNIARETNPKQWFADLWESINGTGSWEANPWVWVIEFKRLPCF